MKKLWRNREEQLQVYINISRSDKDNIRYVNAVNKLKKRMITFMSTEDIKEYRKSYYNKNKTKLKQKRRLYCNKIKLEDKYKKDHHPKSVKDGGVYKGYCIECGAAFVSRFGWCIRCDTHKWRRKS